jgi:glycosyltransferase involved in cell wall biosynthesis
MGRFGNIMVAIQNWVEHSEVEKRSSRISALIREISPDLVHAMRVPFEGIMAALADPPAPLLVSIWGNDLTLFAQRFASTRRYTQRALARTDALHCDCYRDLKLSSQFGFDSRKPSIVVPGNGGIQMDLFAERREQDGAFKGRFGIPEDVPLVSNPRGFRSYVRSDTFFHSVALTIKRRPDVIFAAVGMLGHPVAQRWVSSLQIEKNVRLLPALSRQDMAALLRISQVAVSPSEHDGTPNTLLETMAAGAFPISGDIESIREWITDGVNGTLIDPSDAQGFSHAIVAAIEDPQLRTKAADQNRKIIEDRAEYDSCMDRAEHFYSLFLGRPELSTAKIP